MYLNLSVLHAVSSDLLVLRLIWILPWGWCISRLSWAYFIEYSQPRAHLLCKHVHIECAVQEEAGLDVTLLVLYLGRSLFRESHILREYLLVGHGLSIARADVLAEDGELRVQELATIAIWAKASLMKLYAGLSLEVRWNMLLLD